MDANKKILALFTTRMRRMTLQYRETKQKNNSLYAMVDECDAKMKQFEMKLNRVQNDYSNLKLTKMMEVFTTDLEAAKRRLSKLVGDVNKCIVLLNEK